MINKPRTGKFLNCFGCSKQCYMPINRLKSFKYCSRDCKNKFGCTQKITTICNICGKSFEHISSRCNKAKYCSRSCYYRSQKGRGSQEYECAHCHKAFMGSPSKRYKFCTKECRGLFQRQTETYGNSANIRKFWLKRGIIQKCEICGYDEVKEILGIHHKTDKTCLSAMDSINECLIDFIKNIPDEILENIKEE